MMLPIDHIEAPIIRNLKIPDYATIVVVGAYKGATVRFIKYCFPTASIYAYEPQKFAYDELIKSQRRGVRSYNLALGTNTLASASLYESGTDAASLLPLPEYRTRETVSVVDARTVFMGLGIIHVDFMLMNIEGYEYYLLPYLLSTTKGIPVIKTFLVQFHFKERYDKLWKACRELLIDKGYTDLFIGHGWELWQIPT